MRRLLAPAALVAALALAVPAHAAPFTYTDPADMPANGGLDILSVTYATTGKGKGKSYVPSTLVATMTLGAPPIQQAGFGYVVDATVDGCGAFQFSYSPGSATSSVIGEAILFVGCGGAPDPTGGEGQILSPKFTVAGNVLTWSIGLKALPKETRAGAVLSELASHVDAVDPVFGLRVLEGAPAVYDNAATDATWKIS